MGDLSPWFEGWPYESKREAREKIDTWIKQCKEASAATDAHKALEANNKKVEELRKAIPKKEVNFAGVQKNSKAIDEAVNKKDQAAGESIGLMFRIDKLGPGFCGPDGKGPANPNQGLTRKSYGCFTKETHAACVAIKDDERGKAERTAVFWSALTLAYCSQQDPGVRTRCKCTECKYRTEKCCIDGNESVCTSWDGITDPRSFRNPCQKNSKGSRMFMQHFV